MSMMEITTNQNGYTRTMLTWVALFIFISVCETVMTSLHDYHTQKIMTDGELIKEKTFLITEMHKEMLLITRTQLELLHATNETHVITKLSDLSSLVSSYLLNYYQFKNVADEYDVGLLNKFKLSFEKWQGFNEGLLTYANIISDSDFINTLNKVDMAINQLDGNETLLLISKLEDSANNIN